MDAPAQTNDQVNVKPVQEGKYIRTRGTQRENLEQALIGRYTIPKFSGSCWIFSSGMNAISSLFQSEFSKCVQKGDKKIVYIVSDEVYTDTTRVLKYMSKTFPTTFEWEKVDVQNPDEVTRVFKKYNSSIRLFFLESCSNPSGKMFNFGLLKTLRQTAPKCMVAVDNTWLSSVLFNPFSVGVNYVVNSLSKYYSGGSCIGGALLGSVPDMKAVIEYALVTGVHVSPKQCHLILERMQDIDKRVHGAGVLALKVATWLESSTKVTRVLYPLLESHPSYRVARDILKNEGPGVISFHVPVEKKNTRGWVQGWVENYSDLIVFETSFGDDTTKIDPWPEVGTARRHDPNPLSNPGPNGTWIRLSVAWNGDYERIIEHLQKMLTNLPSSDAKS